MHRTRPVRTRPHAMLARALGVAALAALLLPSAAYGSGSPLATGTVRNASTSAAISGASVTAYHYDTGMGGWFWAGAVSTTGDGTYTLLDEYGGYPGDYQLVVSAEGFVAGTADFVWDGGPAITVNVGLSPVTADAYEPDGSSAAATPIATNGAAQVHTIYPAGDTDWVSFSASAGTRYTVQTAPRIAGETDTYLVLYDSDGTTVLAENDDWSGAFSRVVYDASANETLWAMVRHAEGTGIGAYDLSVTESPSPKTIATGVVTDAGTTDRIAGATVSITTFENATGDWVYAGATTTAVDGTYALIDQFAYGGGTYRFYVSADDHFGQLLQTNWNGVDARLLDFALEPVAADAYEPDDTSGQARAVTPNISETHTLYPAGDRDWITFSTVAGKRYLIGTGTHVAGETDTHLTLYASDGTTVLADNDDYGSPFSYIRWDASASQTVFARVRHADDGTGTGAYTLSVTEVAGDPVIASGTVSAVVGGAPIAGAHVSAYFSDPSMGLSLADTVETGADGSFALVDSDGYGAGEYVFEVSAAGYADRSETLAWNGTTALSLKYALLPRVEEIAASGATELSVLASGRAFPDGASTVVIGPATIFPELLASASLCGVEDAPLLLTGSTTLAPAVSAEIARLGASEAVIVGGTAAVSGGVEAELEALLGASKVTRIAGSNRYGTAALVAQHVAAVSGEPTTTAFVVSGANAYGSGLAAPVAYGADVPILPTASASLSPETAAVIDSLGIERVIVIGGTTDVSDSVITALGGRPTVTSVERWAGTDWRDTSRVVASAFHAAEWLAPAAYEVAEYEDWVADLVGGVVAGVRGDAVLYGDTANGLNAATIVMLSSAGDVGLVHRVTLVADRVTEACRGRVVLGQAEWAAFGADTTAPCATDDAGGAYDDVASVHITARDGGSGVTSIEYRLDGEATQTVSGSAATVTTSAAGGHTLRYLARDGSDNVSGVVERQFTVTAVNAAPSATADSYTMTKNTVLTVSAPGVLANDSDPDSDPLTTDRTGSTGPSHGSLTLNANGSFTYTPDTGWYGTDTFTYRAHDTIAYSGYATVTITVNDASATVAYVPLEGSDRYGTAVAVSKSAFPSGANAVILATGLNFPDALASAGLAGVVDAPVLLVHGSETTLKRDGLAIAEVDRVLLGKNPKRVYIIGGTVAVSSGIESALKARYGAANVVRLGGADRYGTAYVVAARMKAEMASRAIPWTGDAFVVPGLDFRDALIVGPEAYAANRPIMLYDPRGTGGLTSYCAALGVTRGQVSGATSGTGSVPTSLALPGVTLSRIANATTAPARSVQVANWAASALPGFGWSYVGIATADLYPDGLSAAPKMGESAGPLLLTPSATLDAGVRSALVTNDATITEVRFFGGPVAVTPAVRSAVDGALH